MNRPQFGQLDALIFDMDGVLINSEPLHERAKREALLEAGIMVPASLFASYTGRSDKAMIYGVAAGHGLNEQRGAEILDRKHRIYESLEHTLHPVAGLSSLCIGRVLAIDLPWLHPQHRAIDRQH
jgi:beta-phosphoglucomutase-like phosphatase (HAD superfamily)